MLITQSFPRGSPPEHGYANPGVQVEVLHCKSEGIEPFTLVNSPPGQVEDASSHTINSPSGQVEDASSHNGHLSTVSSRGLSSQIRRYRALQPGQLSPGQVEDVSSYMVNSLPCQVGAMSSCPINSLSGLPRGLVPNVLYVQPSVLESGYALLKEYSYTLQLLSTCSVMTA